MNTFGVSELVRVLEDMESVKRLQAGHGEWTDSMAPVRSFNLITPAFERSMTDETILQIRDDTLQCHIQIDTAHW